MDLPANGHELDRLIKAHGFTRGAELGVRRGELTASLLERHPGLTMIAVDLWSPHSSFTEQYDHDANLARFQENTRPFRDRLVVYRRLLHEAAQLVPDGSLDFVFIDATHTYAALSADIRAWAPKVKPHGLIAGHDYHPAWDDGGVIRCVDETFRSRWLADDSCWFGWKRDMVDARAAGRPLVYDGFCFFNELDLLELRLEELSDVVDVFVLVEATKTFSGRPKPLLFSANRARFEKFLPRIRHVVVDDLPGPPATHWNREAQQRDAILRGLWDARPDDVVIVADLDEIPRPAAVRRFVEHGSEAAAFRQTMYYYRLNCQNVSGSPRDPWAVILLRKLLRSPQEARLARFQLPAIEDGGWHFSYLGDPPTIREKIGAISHATELDVPRFTDEETIARRIATGSDLYDRPDHAWRYVPIDETFPRFVRRHPEKFARFIAPVAADERAP